MRSKTVVALAGFALSTSAYTALAQIAWDNPTGSGLVFDFSGGETDFDLFGSPGVVGNTFVFTPDSFIATSDNGNGAQTDDRLEVRLDSKAFGPGITGLRIREFGSYSVEGTGSATVSGTTQIIQAIGGVRVDNLVAPPSFTSGAGDWQASLDIDFELAPGFPQPQPFVILVFNNDLTATSSAGNTSWIQKNRIEIEVLPTPSTAALLGLGSLVAFRRRR